MITSTLSILQDKNALSKDKKPMQPGQYDLNGGVLIIDIPRFFRGVSAVLSSDFTLYDNVTSPDGATLIQGQGRAYLGRVRNGELEFEVRVIDDLPLPFGVLGFYKNDYFLANREFVDALSAKFQ